MVRAVSAPSPAYTASKDQLRARLARIEGQVSGVARMVEVVECYCIDALTQISAVQAALDKVVLGLLDGHELQSSEGEPGELEARTDELMGAVRRLDAAR